MRSFFILILFLFSFKVLSKEVIRHNYIFDHFEVIRKILIAALEETKEEYGDYELVESSFVSQGREVELVRENKKFQIMWSMSSPDRESKLQSIPIPLLKGLIGLRLLLIKSEDQKKFPSSLSIEDFKNIKLGQANDWPDSDILAANGLRLFRFEDYNFSFKQLNNNSFDAYPRGITEAHTEIKEHKELSLSVEENHAFYYQAPMFFYVSKENTRLHDRILKGLNRLIDKQKYDQILFKDKRIRQAISQANISKRKIHYLSNPLFKNYDILKDSRLWLDITKIDETLKMP